MVAKVYGHRIIFYRVERMDDEAYRETEIGTIGPEWLPGNLGTHTYSFDDRYEAIDGRVRVLRGLRLRGRRQTDTMKFSICIPNYNYGRYLGRTIQSVLDQQGADFELLVSDNASPDNSVDVVQSFADPSHRLQINACNVGFAGNLDKAAGMASNELMIMLSSDDLMRPGASPWHITNSSKPWGQSPAVRSPARPGR